jgi:hypothetical protein
MTVTADAPSTTAPIPMPSSAPAPLDIAIATGSARDAAVTVRGPVDPRGAATVVELVSVLVAAGAVHVIVDLDGADPHRDAGVSRKLQPLASMLRARGGRLLIAGGTVSVLGTSPHDSDLQEAFSAYREVIAAGGAGIPAQRAVPAAPVR